MEYNQFDEEKGKGYQKPILSEDQAKELIADIGFLGQYNDFSNEYKTPFGSKILSSHFEDDYNLSHWINILENNKGSEK